MATITKPIALDETLQRVAGALENIQLGKGAEKVIAAIYSNNATYAVGDYTIHDGKLYSCSTVIATPESWTEEHWTEILLSDEVKRALANAGTIKDVKVDGVSVVNNGIANVDGISDIKSVISGIGISNNPIINRAIPELYVSGVDLSGIDQIAINKSSGGYTFYFKANGTNQFTMLFPLTGDVRVSVEGTSQRFGIAVFADNIDELIPSTTIDCVFNTEKVYVMSANPYISETLFAKNMAFVPSYTRTTSKRISTSGQIVDAGSGWFYSSPIQTKKGDIVKLLCSGNSNAAPLSTTDEEGTSYTPCLVYSGTDPDNYTYVCESNGYLCVSLNTRFSYYIYIIRPALGSNDSGDSGDYVSANQGVENAGKVLSVDESGEVAPTMLVIPSGGDSGIPIEAVDYSIRKPNIIKSVDVESLSGWVANGVTLSLTRKYNNITKINRQCVSVTSESGNGLAYFNLDSAVDATQKALLFEISIGEYSNTNPPVGNVAIELFSGSGRTSTYKASFIVQGNTGDSSYNPVYNHNGWFVACLFFPSLEGKLVTIGSSFDPTNVTAIGVHPYNTTGAANTVHIAQMAFVDAMQKPGICTIIDNFGVSVPAMADYAYSKGVRLNLSIIPGFYAGASGAPTCASKAELDRVAQQGHCIWNHTWTHAILNNLAYPQIQDQVNLAETWMQINGYDDFKEFVSNPSARFNTATCNALLDTNAKMIFHKWVGSPKCVYIPYHPTRRCIPTTILDQEVSGTMTGTDIGTVAQKAMTYGGITVVGFHGTYWELDDGVSWKAYIDKIASIENVYHYGLDEIHNGQWC